MKKKKRKLKKWALVMFIILLVIVVAATILLSFLWAKKHPRVKKEPEVKIDYEKIAQENYHELVKATKDITIYDEEDNKVGTIYEGKSIHLEEVKGRKYKIQATNYYIDYQDLEEIENIEVKKHTEYADYKNYIPYNINIITNDEFKMYIENEPELEINQSQEFIVYIKTADKYGVEFNNRLFYINKDDVREEKEASNSNEEISTGLGVLNYHYTVNRAAGELNECVQEICMEDTQVEEQIKYLSDNNYYTLSMRDVYLFVTGAIRIPKRSVAITIDDGWYVERMIKILTDYQKNGTLFLIGSLMPPEAYASEYLEVHSHSWNMHNIGVCGGSHHGGAILCWPEDQIIEDLTRSRESLNNTTVFCYPFYEYNNRAINLLQQVGFEMAFTGGERKVHVGDNLLALPRFVMVNYTTMNDFLSCIN